MKKFLLSLLAMALIAPLTLKADDDIPIPVDQLPAASKEFVKQYFADKTIVYAEKEMKYAGVEYQARLSDGAKINFNGDGSLDKVDCKYYAVPAALVPEVIATYVQTNYPGVMITKIDKELYGYEIEINNGLDLKFSPTGQLLGIDD